jgi:hypothetical protein
MHQNYKLFDFFQEWYQLIYIHQDNQALNLYNTREMAQKEQAKPNFVSQKRGNKRNNEPVVSGSLHAASAAIISTIPIIIPTVTGLIEEKTI